MKPPVASLLLLFSSSTSNDNGRLLRSEDAATLGAAALMGLSSVGVLDLDAWLSDASLAAAAVGLPAAALTQAVAGAAEQRWAANAEIGLEDGVAVRASRLLGGGERGAFATRPLAAGTFLAEYRGETLNLDAYLERYHPQEQQQQQQQPDYVWRVHDDCFLDASDESRSNWCRFVNHAPAAARAAAAPSSEGEEEGLRDGSRTANVLVLRRSPLLRPLPWTRWVQRWLPRGGGGGGGSSGNGGGGGGGSGVYFFAARDIVEGEELFCDYGPRFWERKEGGGGGGGAGAGAAERIDKIVMEAATGAAEGDGSGASSDVRIRQHASSEDEELWRRLLEPTFRAGETYCVPRDVSKADALAYWCMPPHEVFVARAADADGEGEEGIIGTYFITPNQPRRGGGGHVCNCGFITAAGAEGRGVARAMLRHALDHAKESGYRAMQFNFVVSTNIRAVDTWKRAGFQKAGTLPRAFDHPKKGLVDAYVMFRELV